MLSDEDHAALRALGYARALGGSGRLLSPDGAPVREEALDRFRHLAGRHSNVGYMAAAIDALDGVEGEGPRRADAFEGAMQFHHLVSFDPPVAALYVAARRLQRDGDVDGLRRALLVILAYGFEELCARDALALVWRNEWQRPAPLRRLADDGRLALPEG